METAIRSKKNVHPILIAMTPSSAMLSISLVLMMAFLARSDVLPGLDTDLDHDYQVIAVHDCEVPGEENLPIRWRNVSLQRVSQTVISIFAIVEQDCDIDDSETFLLEIQLFAKDGDDENSKHMMLDYTMAEVCHKMKGRDSEVLNAFVDSVQGLDGCPIPKGSYPVHDFQVKIKDLKPFLREGKMGLGLHMRVGTKELSCTAIELLVTACDD